jgi:hypothetical protein
MTSQPTADGWKMERSVSLIPDLKKLAMEKVQAWRGMA